MTRFDSQYARFVHAYPYPRQLRSYKTTALRDAVVFRGSKKLIDFSSNDYLGLSKHPLLIARSNEFSNQYGAGSSSSRMVRGNLTIYHSLEETLAKALGKETALILGSGFQTNATLLEALLNPTVLGQEPLIFCDKACHASIYMGLAASSQPVHRFRHNDLDHLQRLLEHYAASKRPKFIITESIYSMEGDQTNLLRLAELSRQHQALWYLDDAHAIGIYGADGFGKATEQSHDIDVIMGTFSKALGSFGSYVACSAACREYLIHRCKGLIYATALPPSTLGAISAALELLPSLKEEREKVLGYAQRVRHSMDEQGLSYGRSSTHIVPWIIGSAEQTRHVAQQLEEEGILGAPIQAPSVPARQNRIRFCLSALHTEEDVALLCAAIKKVIRSVDREVLFV